MTAQRQNPNPGRAAAVLGTIILAVALGTARMALAGLTQQIVIDWRTGLAIDGYDPVAFFTDGAPVLGSADLELRYAGAVWRFRNVGNRAAFADRPDVYMPRYGGYDPVDIARGVAVAGNPTIWTIADQRLYLFYDDTRREKFLADTGRYVAAAERKWPLVSGALDP